MFPFCMIIAGHHLRRLTGGMNELLNVSFSTVSQVLELCEGCS
jgi:hypothetical protein